MTQAVKKFGVVGLAAVLVGGFAGCSSVIDKEANARWKAALGNTSITVFPAVVRKGETREYSHEATGSLKEFFEEAKWAVVTVSDIEVDLWSEPGRNQSRMYRDSIASFAAWLKEHPVETDYAMVCEYLCSSNGKVGGIHAYVLEKEGLCAYGVGLNSHHKPFNEAILKNAEDCTKVVIKAMREELAPAAKE